MRLKLKRSRVREYIVFYGIGLLGIVVFFFPVYWMLSIAIKPPDQSFNPDPRLLLRPTLYNFESVLIGRLGSGFDLTEVGMGFWQSPFSRGLINSTIITTCSIFIALILGVPAAYSLARFDFRGKRDMSFFILSTRMAPPIGFLIPMYLVFSRLQLIDTHIALIIMYINLNLAMVVWMMMGFFKDVPAEIEEAAMIDGCSRLQALRRVVMPLAAPGLAATVIFCAFLSWNEFIWALILTGRVAKTAPVAALGLVQYRKILWGQLMAAGTVISLPVLLFALFTQRQLVRGLTFGAIK